MKERLVIGFIIFAIIKIAFADDSVLSRKLESAIIKKDKYEVIEVINDIKGVGRYDEAYDLLLTIWKEDKSQHPDFDWLFLGNDLIKINIADALIQATRNGFIKADTDELYEYSKSAINHKDVRVTMEAFLTIAYFNKTEDARLIESFLYKDNIRLYRAALLALAIMCNDEVNKIINRLEEKPISNKKKKILEETKKFREKIKTDQCKSK